MKLCLYVVALFSMALVVSIAYYFGWPIILKMVHFDVWLQSILGHKCFPHWRRRTQWWLSQWCWFDGVISWQPTNRLHTCKFFIWKAFQTKIGDHKTFTLSVFVLFVWYYCAKDGFAKIVENNPDLKWWFDEIEKTVLNMTDKVCVGEINSFHIWTKLWVVFENNYLFIRQHFY